MIKRTNGYILLTLLVVTGLASQVPRQTLTGKERKYMVVSLKETKATFLQSINDLSKEQLVFAPPGQQSVQELMQQQALAEEALWSVVKKEIDSPSAQKNSVQPIISSIKISGNNDLKFADAAYKKQPAVPAGKAVKVFTEARNNVILYAKTTTDNARRHYVNTPFGTISLYNLILSITANTVYYTQQINEVKEQPGFPK